jgi:DNA ligase-associated metallophosphoesterase
VDVYGRSLLLDPSGAVVDPIAGRLYVADLHLGKGAVFRQAGLAVPTGDSRATLARLGEVLHRHGVGELWILGDLVHAAASWTPELVGAGAAWRNAHAGVRMHLVPGNHDRRSGAPPSSWRIERAAPGKTEDGLHLRHEPDFGEPGPALAGHLHPVIRLRETRSSGLRARCFWAHGGTLVLPAFGGFTGGHRVRPDPGDRIFAVGPAHVVEIPVPGPS